MGKTNNNFLQILKVMFFLNMFLTVSSNAGLIFEKNGEIEFEVTDDGSIYNVQVEMESEIAPVSGDLIIEHNNNLVCHVNNKTLSFTDVLVGHSSINGNGLIIDNSEGISVAQFNVNSASLLTGRFSRMVLMSSVSYIDNTLTIENGSLDYYNINSPFGLEGRSESGVEYFYVKDHLGSIRLTLHEEDEVAKIAGYSEYASLGNHDQVSSNDNRETFTGKEFDKDGNINGAEGIKLFYFGARYYDPEVGLWISTDDANQYFSPYAYSGSPVMYIDADGNYAWPAYVVAAVVGAAMGAAKASRDDPGNTEEIVKGAIVGGVSSVLGLASSNLSIYASDALIAGTSAHGFAYQSTAVVTEVGISALFSATTSSIVQGIAVGFGWQEKIDAGQVGLAAFNAAFSTSLKISKYGYLVDSRQAAQKHLDEMERAEFKRLSKGVDLYTDRQRFYREGGYLDKMGRTRVNAPNGKEFQGPLAGLHNSDQQNEVLIFGGKDKSQTFNFDKRDRTFIHEMGHRLLGTSDYDIGNNAYSFESYMTKSSITDPNNETPDGRRIIWKSGIPYNSSGTVLEDLEYTNW